MNTAAEPERSSVVPWRRRLVVILIAVVTLSIIGRVTLAKDAEEKEEQQPQVAHALVSGQEPPPEQAEPEPSGVGKVLPFLTEGGISMLLGIALGVATRTFMRIMLLLFAGCFILIQVLVYNGVMTIDWGVFAQFLGDFVLNVSSDEGPGAIIKHKLPSAGGFMAGLYLGFKKG